MCEGGAECVREGISVKNVMRDECEGGDDCEGGKSVKEGRGGVREEEKR